MTNPFPEGFTAVTPYLVVEDVAALLSFLEKAFGARETERLYRSDGSIMHAQAQIGDAMIMMGGATPDFMPITSMVHLYVADVDAAYAQALVAGATPIMPPEDQFYGDRSGGVADPSGNRWWIATHIEDVSSEDMQMRASEQT